MQNGEEKPYIPSAHVGAIYASRRARLSVGEIASMHIDGEQMEGHAFADGEIEVRNSKGEIIQSYQFLTDAEGEYKFGTGLENVDLNLPDGSVTVGYSEEMRFVGDVSVTARELKFDCRDIVALGNIGGAGAIYLEAEEVESSVESRPVTYQGTVLAVVWDGNRAYPWSDYAIEKPSMPNPDIADAGKRMFKILRLFQVGAGQSGQLVKYRGSIDHARRGNGWGAAVREQLVEEGILTRNRIFYFLNADKLYDVAGVKFQDVRMGQRHEKTDQFLARAVSRSS